MKIPRWLLKHKKLDQHIGVLKSVLYAKMTNTEQLAYTRSGTKTTYIPRGVRCRHPELCDRLGFYEAARTWRDNIEKKGCT